MPIQKIVQMPDGTYRIVLYDPETGQEVHSTSMNTKDEGLEDGAVFVGRDPQDQNKFNIYDWGSEDGLRFSESIMKGHPSYQANDSVSNLIAERLKSTKQKTGGKMTYQQYLAGGGEVSDEEQKQMNEDKQKDRAQLEAFKQDPQGFLQAAGEDVQSTVMYIMNKAAELQDDEALSKIEPIARKLGINGFKCGGKVRRKVKKAACGAKTKKVEKGTVVANIEPVKASVGTKVKPTCPCKLHRIGGKLVTINSCTGFPINIKF